MKDFASGFYKSKTWQQCRTSYLKSVGGLCERCYQKGLFIPAKIVHHKTYLTPDNINDPDVSLNWDNLEAICKPCHEAEHEYCGRKEQKRYAVDEFGKIIGIDL